MTGHTFVLILALGAAALALWVDHRFSRFAPDDLRKTMIHVLVSIVTIHLIVRTAFGATVVPGDAVRTLVGVFGIALPGLVYSFLVGVWVIRRMQEAIGRYSH